MERNCALIGFKIVKKDCVLFFLCSLKCNSNETYISNNSTLYSSSRVGIFDI